MTLLSIIKSGILFTILTTKCSEAFVKQVPFRPSIVPSTSSSSLQMVLDENMMNRLQSIQRSYQALTERLADPDVIGDSNLLRKVMSDRSQSEEVVQVFEQYKQLQENLDGAKELLQDPDMKIFSQQIVESMMVNAAKEDKLMAIKAFDMTSRSALISTYQDLLEWDSLSHEKIQQCRMPVMNIQSSRPFCSESSLQKLCQHLISSKVVNSGPWATLEVPAQVNTILDRFLNL